MDTVRLYFNKRGDKPWSVDTGDGTKEYMCREVKVFARRGKTVYDPLVIDTESKPSAWVEFPDAVAVFWGQDIEIHDADVM